MRVSAVDVKNANVLGVSKNGTWVPVRSENHRFESWGSRIKNAYAVLTGKADALFWEDEHYNETDILRVGEIVQAHVAHNPNKPNLTIRWWEVKILGVGEQKVSYSMVWSDGELATTADIDTFRWNRANV